MRALLLTDVVDSTKLSMQLGDAAMARLWTAHDRAARDLIPAWRGREIDKTDGMLLLFDSATDAVAYALAYQQALAALSPPLFARAGLHVGAVTLRENASADVARGAKPLEVDGVAKATVARVMSLALSGQILLSDAARDALGACSQRIQSHGHWRLKGLDEPMELFEVGEAHTSFAPPQDTVKAYRVVRQVDRWVPASAIRHNLPAERDGFIGRSQALAELSRRIQDGARLVSVLGMGGTGKTRLATHFGWYWLGDFPGGVWFCDLSAARGLDSLVQAVAQGLDVPLRQGDAAAQLGQAVAGRGRCLVILDNFEQVASHAMHTLGPWLDRAAEACFIVTTREVLGLPGEEVLALPPLPNADGAALFRQRARSAHPEYQFSDEDEAAVVPLVALLDGLPLAIELAAARVRVMPPRTLLLRMDERFKLLSSKSGRLGRHATLRATFDWSWELLAPAEKSALAQLSVFEGGFTLAAAEAVIELAPFDDAWPPDLVQSLVEKSFVRHRGDGRFDLLVSVQVYAAEHLRTPGRLPGSGPQALAAVQRRHLQCFADLGPESAAEGRGAELDNLLTACRRAIDLGECDLAVSALEGAAAILSLRGPFETGAELAAAVCALPGLSHRSAARALAARGQALHACGQLAAARGAYDEALSRARNAGDRHAECEVLRCLGVVQGDEGHSARARELHGAALSIALELGDRRLECRAFNSLGTIEVGEGESAVALQHFESALSLARAIGDRRMQGNLLGNLGSLFVDIGRIDEAQRSTEEALAIARKTAHRRLEGNSQCNLAMILYVQNRLEESAAASRAALVVARELGHVQLEGVALCNLGIAVERLGRPDEALAHYEFALRIARAFGDPRMEGEYLGYLGLLHARQARPEDARRCGAAGEALLRAVSSPFGLGMLLAGRAEAHHLAGDIEAAAQALAEAGDIAIRHAAGPGSDLRLALARVAALLATPAAPAPPAIDRA